MRLLLGVGDDDRSRSALQATVERVRETGDDLTVAVFAEGGRSVEAVEREVRERLDREGVDAAVRRLEGDPGSQLVALAEREGFDRLVVGGKESPMGKVELGPIAQYVLLNCKTTVTIVR